MVALALWLASGIFQIKAAEQGVILRFGKLVDIRNQGAGWRFPWPIETLIKVNVASVNSSEYKSRVLTSDVNLVDLRFAVQYQLSDPRKVLFRVKDPVSTLSEVSEMAIREIVGRSELDDVLVGKTRPDITRRTKELIQHTLDTYNTGITITTVNLTDVQVPEAVIPSQRDANKALADQERFVKESQAYANKHHSRRPGGSRPHATGCRGLQVPGDCRGRRAGVARHATGGSLGPGPRGDAPAALHGHLRERAVACPHGADRR